MLDRGSVQTFKSFVYHALLFPLEWWSRFIQIIYSQLHTLFSQITYTRSFKFSLDNPIINPNSRLAFSITWSNYEMKTDVTILLTVGLRCSQTMTFGRILNKSETLQFVSLNPQKIHCFDACTKKKLNSERTRNFKNSTCFYWFERWPMVLLE